jgi:hypothetical protein
MKNKTLTQVGDNISLKVFLQDCKTAKLMRCDSMWTEEFHEAMDFLSVRSAVAFGMKELRDSFQLMRIESNEFSGVVTIAISNLSWPEGSQLVPSISLTNPLPKLDRAHEFYPSPGVVAGGPRNLREGQFYVAKY